MENLIRKLAWTYAKKAFNQDLNIDFEELMAEANLAYLEALRTHDESKGKVSTWIWTCVEGALKNYIRKEHSFHTFERLNVNPDEFHEFYHASNGWDYLNLLTKEAQDIAKIIISTPNDVVCDLVCMTQEDAQVKIVQDLLDKGWSWSKIYLGFKNLKTVFSQ